LWHVDAVRRLADAQIRGARMRWIPPGRFWMGSPADAAGRSDNEGPLHAVTVAEGFWLFETACTEALWEAVTGRPPEPRRGGEFPVTGVSWDDVQAFVQRVNAAARFCTGST
jgi:formylglycine-generating enzyme required for sulfatase activity